MHLWRMFGAAACFIAALFLLISLISYHAHDATSLHATLETMPISNWCGSYGAQVSSWTLFLFGFSSFLLIPALIFFGLHLVIDGSVPLLHRGFALLVAIPLSTLFFVLNRYEVYPSILPGGVCGQQLMLFLHAFVDPSLVPLILFFSSWALLIFVAGFAWVVPCVVLLQRLCSKLKLDVVVRPCVYHLIHRYNAATKLISDYTGKIKNIVWDEDKPVVEDIETIVYDASFWKQHMQIDPIQQQQEEAAPEIIAGAIARDEGVHIAERQIVQEPQKAQPSIYHKPDVKLLQHKRSDATKADKQQQQNQAQVLEEKLRRFGIKGSVVTITAGPVVTLFEYQPHIDVPISRILAREDDLALALQALSLRIIAPIPGKSVIGFEVSNAQRKTVLFAESVNAPTFTSHDGQLPLIIGQSTIGEQVVIDLAKMPHLLVAGSTGSGKSVALNAMLVSLLCKATPDEVRMILIDPKRLEFAAYADIPHLVFPIVTDPHLAMTVLQWAIMTMEQRYESMAAAGVRNIYDYRALKKETLSQEAPPQEAMPYIVIVIDELADLMMVAGKDIEASIARLAQMARASGIHLVLATQRPSVDVITGVVKVNFPARVACKVTSKVDSRTILDTGGAEKLLGKGDMLFLDPQGKLNRLHGAYVTDDEIAQVVAHVKSQRAVVYEKLPESTKDCSLQGEDAVLYKELVEFVKSVDEVSISLLQRRFRIGYNRSARFIDILEAQGIILPSAGGKTRKVLH